MNAVNLSDIPLSTLRGLRERADNLLKNLVEDLRPFTHQDTYTFLRTPESQPITGDVNVTTTCSCVMALAGTHRFDEYYKANTSKAGDEIVKRLLKAPWMSSGLFLNNAFTTVLVIRTCGYLANHTLLSEKVAALKKKWNPALRIKNLDTVAAKLNKPNAHAGLKFLYSSLADNTRAMLGDVTKNRDRLLAAVTSDLRRIMQSGWIYEEERFGKVDAEILKDVQKDINAYKVTEFNYGLLSTLFKGDIDALKDRTLGDMANEMSADPEKNFAINDYPASPAVVYWFVDGIDRGGVELDSNNWTKLCQWARVEFNRQLSLVMARDEPLMDPIAMAMAACVCARLRTISAQPRLGMTKSHLAELPADSELENAVLELFALQPESGIWPKYFPMFHYQDQSAGSNFCFAFELLEAILHEFGEPTGRLLKSELFVKGFEKAVAWCETNRFTPDKSPQSGWNSGGSITTLRRNQPESWATAVVHMFLYELTQVISRHIQKRVLASYRTTLHEVADDSDLNKLVDIEVLFPELKTATKLSAVLRDRFVTVHKGQTEQSLRHGHKLRPTSALLFGPPGTSKTEVTKAVASALGWPLVTITPLEFVRQTIDKVFLQADEIFTDVMDLSGVVVFFDEMDALMQSREEGRLDTQTQFLTTAMLPKLAELRKQGRVLFFMATNYQAKFDPAIKRAGRFDLLLCMGPPTWEEKLNRLEAFFDKPKLTPGEKATASKSLRKFVKGDELLRQQLELYTFAEFRSFLHGIGSGKNLGTELGKMGKAEFKKKATAYSRSVVLNLQDLPGKVARKIWDWDEFPSNREEQALKKEIGRYLRDRKMSRIQYD